MIVCYPNICNRIHDSIIIMQLTTLNTSRLNLAKHQQNIILSIFSLRILNE